MNACSRENSCCLLFCTLTISFLSKARAASRFAGLFASRLSVLFLPRLKSSWIMVFFTYILSISLHEPPLELSSPLRLLGSGGRPSIQASTPPAAPFPVLPFILAFTNNTLCSQTSVQQRHVIMFLKTFTPWCRKIHVPATTPNSTIICVRLQLALPVDLKTQNRLGVAANDGQRGHEY